VWHPSSARKPLTGAAVAPQPRRVRVLIAVAVLVLAADIITKVIVVATCHPAAGPAARRAGDAAVDRNPGAAFSIGTSMTLVFSAIAVQCDHLYPAHVAPDLQRAWASRWPAARRRHRESGGPAAAVSAVWRGYVVDWIQLPHWPVFNVADSSIVCGGILAVLLAAAESGSTTGLAPASGPDGGRPGGGHLASARPRRLAWGRLAWRRLT